MEDFSNEEIVRIIPLYKDVFGFKGQISQSLFDALRNGFFLRIFSEVYSQREIPKEINSKELIGRYIIKSLEKTNLNIQVGLRILSKIGKALIEHKYTALEFYEDEGLGVESILEKLEFSLDETIPEALFARNILIKSNKEDSYNISFYYSKIRDYIICYYSYKLDKLADNEFYNLLEIFYENYIGQSAITFYIENASDKHKRTFIKFKEDKALNYVISYDCYLEDNFKNFKNKFDPETVGPIGIFLSENLLHEDGYALFHLGPGSPNKVQYTNLKNPFSRDYDTNPLILKGAKKVYGNYKRLLTANQNKIINKDIFKQLKDIINGGRISVYNSNILLLEQVSTIIYFYSKKLGYNYNLKDYYLPRFNLIYPINLEELREKIYKFRVTEYYNRQDIDLNLRANKISEALKSKLDIPQFGAIGHVPPFEELYKIVEILLNNGYREITEHYLPCPDISIGEIKIPYEEKTNISQMRSLQFSEGQAKLYVEIFLKHFESCYKHFVEYSFPTLKNKFPFFMTLPHEYFVYMKDSNIHKWGYLGYRTSKSGNVKINFKELTSTDEPFEKGETSILHPFTFNKILHSDYHHVYKTFDKISTPEVDDYCVLRNWIYKFLKSDMETLFKENEE